MANILKSLSEIFRKKNEKKVKLSKFVVGIQEIDYRVHPLEFEVSLVVPTTHQFNEEYRMTRTRPYYIIAQTPTPSP